MNTNHKFLMYDDGDGPEVFSDANFVVYFPKKGYYQVTRDGEVFWQNEPEWASEYIGMGKWVEVSLAKALKTLKGASLRKALNALENIEAGGDDISIKLNDEYTAEYKKGDKYVQVGCQKIPKTAIKQLWAAIEKLDKSKKS